MLPHYEIDLDFASLSMESPVQVCDLERGKTEKISWILALNCVRPQWCQNPGTLVVVEDLSAGLCNRNVKFHVADDWHDAVILRQYNYDVMKRWGDDIRRSVAFAHAQSLGPVQIATFRNGICLEYEHGTTVSWKDTQPFLDENLIEPIANEMARYHTREVAEEVVLYGVHHSFIFMREDFVRESWTDAIKCHGLTFERTAPSIEEMLDEWRYVNGIMETVTSAKRLCHYDMNPTNFVRKPDGTMLLIDIDQLAVGFCMCDLDWFFICQCGLMEPDFSKYPDEKYIHEFLRVYFLHRKKLDNETDGVTETEIVVLRDELAMAHLLTLLRMLSCAVVLSCGFSDNIDKRMPNAIVSCWVRYQNLRDATIAKCLKNIDSAAEV